MPAEYSECCETCNGHCTGFCHCHSEKTIEQELNDFFRAIKDVLGPIAKGKGYSEGNLNKKYKNEMMTFVSNNFPGHALGEIVYKAVRYKNRGELNDLIKIAAWATLIYLEDKAR